MGAGAMGSEYGHVATLKEPDQAAAACDFSVGKKDRKCL